MRLSGDEARSRLAGHHHGVLATLHPERGVDAIPVVYAVLGDYVGVPIDRVKPKASLKLQRVANLEADPRATLLIEHWDHDDWSKLWWVRTQLHYEGTQEHARSAELAELLANAFTQYHNQPFADVLVFRTIGTSGWTATEPPP